MGFFSRKKKDVEPVTIGDLITKQTEEATAIPEEVERLVWFDGAPKLIPHIIEYECDIETVGGLAEAIIDMCSTRESDLLLQVTVLDEVEVLYLPSVVVAALLWMHGSPHSSAVKLRVLLPEKEEATYYYEGSYIRIVPDNTIEETEDNEATTSSSCNETF